jgi:biofilm PGA synthesis N-glycosyltransferase PgaC
VVILTWGWAALGEKSANSSGIQRTIAVIVSFRNEAHALPQLIADLKRLDYPADNVEFVLVDDDSSDASVDVARSHIASDGRFTLMANGNHSPGKKNAITRAISSTKAHIVVITDADCRLPVSWLKIINEAFDSDKTKMTAGPVRLSSAGPFGNLQAMEFASLVGTTGATIALGFPVMANSANLAFLRSAFIEVKGYEGNESITSGDDQFLVKKFADKWKGSVGFLYRQGAIVTAGSAPDINTFVEQRLRWAGKWKPAADTSAVLALAILFFHVCNLVVMSLWLFGAISSKAFIILIATKVFAEVIFLFPVCRFIEVKWRWTSFFLLQLFYSLYVISIGFLSQILTARWKGRNVTTRVWTGIS